ncbi:MAG: YihY/virulence factor BrkB family protein [Anaerolineae bacterium]|nr:YihY/virulence factor BrkB family protein [Anaerolineae bacterium]
MNIKTIFNLFKDTFTEWQEDKASRLAAALAYYTVFSLAPLVIIILGLVGYIFGQEATSGYLVEQMQGLMGQEGAALIQTIIAGAAQPTSSMVATIIGLVTLLLGASGVFGQLQDALNTVWGVAPKPGLGIWGFLQTRFLSFTMVLGIGFLLLVSLVLSAALSALDQFLVTLLSDASALALQLLNLVLSFGLVSLLFAMIFKILPDVQIEWRDVWLGAAVTALLFSVGKFLLGYYLGRQSFGSTYGAAGSLLLILLWVYYSAQILLFGAEFTQVYTKRFGSGFRPAKNAIILTPEMRARQGIPHTSPLQEQDDWQTTFSGPDGSTERKENLANESG